MAGKEILENLLKCYLCFPDTQKTPRAKGFHKTETCPVVADKEHEGGFAQHEGG